MFRVFRVLGAWGLGLLGFRVLKVFGVQGSGRLGFSILGFKV